MTADELSMEALAARLCTATDRAHARRPNELDIVAGAGDLDPTDLRWRTAAFDPATTTSWYAQLAPDEQARYCIERLCLMLVVGAEFETQLIRGLDAVVSDDDSWVVRYCAREAAEEAQHCEMFKAFAHAMAPDVAATTEASPGMGDPSVGPSSSVGDAVEAMAVRDPALFFWSVLCGEEPIDALQRRFLATGLAGTHPMLEAMCRYHVADEARHLRFARAYVSALGRTGDHRLSRKLELFVPPAVDRMTRYILSTPAWFIDRWQIPLDSVAEENWEEQDRDLRARSARKLIDLAKSEGLLQARTRPLWSSLLVGRSGGFYV